MENVDINIFRLVPEKKISKFKSNIIYGPIISKRSYHSLGINLWPLGKVCSFKCKYCQCGKNSTKGAIIPLKQMEGEIKKGFKFNSKNNKFIQDILVEGNGEPTIYPYFNEITNYVLELRNIYFPNIPVVLFTNSTTLGKKDIIDSILKYNQVFFKLDSADRKIIKKMNGFDGSLDEIIENLEKVKNLIETNKYPLKNFEISTAVVSSKEGNINSLYSNKFYKIIKSLNPQKLYLYDIDRNIPNKINNYKASFNEIKQLGRYIFDNTGIETIMLYSKSGRGIHELSKINL